MCMYYICIYIYIYIYTCIYTYIHIYIYILPHPRSGDSQGQETFLALSADKQTRIENILNNPSKFKPTNWFQANDDTDTKYSTNSEIKFKTAMLQSSLLDCTNAYIPERETITVVG